jgi:hypothetical protein
VKIEEYYAKRNKIDEESIKKKKELDKEYAFSKNVHEVGDIVASNSCRILIEEIVLGYDFHGIPICSYHGTLVTRKMKPYKTGDRFFVQRDEIIKSWKKEYLH